MFQNIAGKAIQWIVNKKGKRRNYDYENFSDQGNLISRICTSLYLFCCFVSHKMRLCAVLHRLTSHWNKRKTFALPSLNELFMLFKRKIIFVKRYMKWFSSALPPFAELLHFYGLWRKQERNQSHNVFKTKSEQQCGK